LSSKHQEYHAENRKKVIFTIIFIIIAAAAFFLTLGFGVYKISIVHALEVFFDHLTGNIVDERGDYYIWELRAPRALAAILVGAGLSLAGVVMQNDFKNPLAEPYTMGISSGAFLGAVLAMAYGFYIIPIAGNFGEVINAFVLSLVPTAIIVLISMFRKMTPTAMILTGVAIMFLFSSITQIILVTSPSETVASAYEWRVGTFSSIRWQHIPIMLGVSAPLIVLLMLFYKKLNVMYVGDRSAKTLGEDPRNIRIITLVLVSFLTAILVSFTGTIGFIGLVGPQIARIFVGSNNKYLIPASMAFGAAFILIADTVAKVTGTNGLPVGVISSMVGGPLFLYILAKQKKSAWLRSDYPFAVDLYTGVAELLAYRFQDPLHAGEIGDAGGQHAPVFTAVPAASDELRGDAAHGHHSTLLSHLLDEHPGQLLAPVRLL
jgi:ABC-type Fe3+-siderophore transport system permease subunit